MNNKELRVKAQDYTEENGINRNTNQIEKAFIDGALMILNQAKNNESLHLVSKCDCSLLVACEICGEEKNLDGDFWKNKKKHDC